MADTAAQPFHIEPTPGGVGAFVHGIDLARDLNGNTAGVLRQALGDHCVLFFRDQKLTPDQHIAAAEAFGEINVIRRWPNISARSTSTASSPACRPTTRSPWW